MAGPVGREGLAVRNMTRGTVLASRAEVGASFWAKFMGLMGRPSLPPGSGLWLPGDNGIHMFFMRFPIDAVFVGGEDGDGRRRVVALHRSLPPWRGIVPLVRSARGVLELPAGTIDATGTALGDEITLESVAPAA